MTVATASNAIASDEGEAINLSPNTTEQQLYLLEAVQQYEEECLLSSRNQDKFRQGDLQVSDFCPFSTTSASGF